LKRILIAGHGNFATGLYSSVKIILGEQDFITCLDCYVKQGQDIEFEIKSILDSFEPNDEIICLTDLLGGSVNNEFMKIKESRKIKLITGTNLNLLINLILNIESDELIDNYIDEARQGIVNCNFKKDLNIEDEDF